MDPLFPQSSWSRSSSTSSRSSPSSSHSPFYFRIFWNVMVRRRIACFPTNFSSEYLRKTLPIFVFSFSSSYRRIPDMAVYCRNKWWARCSNIGATTRHQRSMSGRFISMGTFDDLPFYALATVVRGFLFAANRQRRGHKPYRRRRIVGII